MAQTDSKKFLKVLYTIFLAGLITLFFGLGVAAFYPQPKPPEYPDVYREKVEPTDGPTVEQKKAEEEYLQKEKEYRPKVADYNRNVSIIILGFAILSLVASLLLSSKIDILPDGLMLGSVFLLLYSIARGFGTEDSRYRFIIVTVGLAVTLVIGYLKFLRNEKSDQ